MSWQDAYRVDIANNPDVVEQRRCMGGKKYSTVQRKAGLMSKGANGRVSVAEYLQKHFDDYDIFSVDPSKKKQPYFHIYAFKKTLGLRDKINTILNESLIKTGLPTYYDMEGQRGTDSIRFLNIIPITEPS